MTSSVDRSHFDAIFAKNDDPWDYRQSWYEARKRALTLAVLPKQHYKRAFEPGCANGEMTAELARRCDRLLACDFSAGAVQIARNRVRALSHVTVEEMCVPDAWPEDRFDLIVISEFGYYLGDTSLAGLVKRLDHALEREGTLIACHWSRPFNDARSTAPAVHRALATVPGLVEAAAHVEPDFLLHAWVRGSKSVAQIQGLA